MWAARALRATENPALGHDVRIAKTGKQSAITTRWVAAIKGGDLMNSALRIIRLLGRLLSLHLSVLGVSSALLPALAAGDSKAAGPVNVETVATGLRFPEGTVFVGETLYFVDYGSSDVLRLTGGAVQRVWHQDGCGANGLVYAGGNLLVACYDSGNIAEITPDGKLLDMIRSDDKGLPFLRPNDLTADQKGGVYFTASGSDTTLGKVYYRGLDRRVREVASNIRYANGLAVSIDGKRLYLAESAANRLLTYTINADGGLDDPNEFVKLADVLGSPRQQDFTPDGVRIDRHGNVFVALYKGGGIVVLSPQGRLIRNIALPGSHHSNLALSLDGRSAFVTAIYDTTAGNSRGDLLRITNLNVE
jgi:gluconolactonase